MCTEIYMKMIISKLGKFDEYRMPGNMREKENN
jgi:hypothetical protein